MIWAALGAPARSWWSLGEEKRSVFPPFVTRPREGFHFAGREWLFYGRTTELAEGNCRDIAVEALDDLPMLLSKAMQR